MVIFYNLFFFYYYSIYVSDIIDYLFLEMYNIELQQLKINAFNRLYDYIL